MPFEITWVDLKGITLREIRERTTNIIGFNLYVQPPKQMRKQTDGYQRDKVLGVGKMEKGGQQVQTSIHKSPGCKVQHGDYSW